MKPSSAKNKGREFQKYVADQISQVFKLGEGDAISCSMGAGGVDIKLSPAARAVFPVSIECKKTRKTPSGGELKQAASNKYSGTHPAVVWCPHGKGPQDSRVMMTLADFLYLVKGGYFDAIK